ncbi:hypothetical protein FNA46_13500 [Rhizobium straminoryzae]|uniref:Uncharacterized protein n=1 Tax=Rhizobium straminoryzae TaxID=1387186 RepID=A0A549T815_9HYPH|nr:hypothetical protein FNA46_13500 [Rhizobium straminoryzae]
MVRTVLVERDLAPEAKIPCADPVPLPDRDLGAAEVQSLWGSDRTSLRICKARQVAANRSTAGGAHAE